MRLWSHAGLDPARRYADVAIRVPPLGSLFASAFPRALASGYRAEIDGLRALAVASVILFHAGLGFMPGGYVGVDIFFVISGFLITRIIVAEIESGSFSLSGFYERRIRRILPALFVVMFSCLVPAWLWMMPGQLREFGQSLMAVTVFGSNFLFWSNTGYFQEAAEESPLIHTWSLGVEEQFYVVFPLLVILLWSFGRPRLALTAGLVTLASLAVSEFAARNHPVAAFFLIPARAWELGLGAILALIPRTSDPDRRLGDDTRELLALLGLTLAVTPMFLYSRDTPFPGLAAAVPALGAALVIVFAGRNTAVGKILCLKPVVAVGLVSYSAYLWHQPLFAFARIYQLDQPSGTLVASMIAAAFALAYVTWRFVELPFRDRRNFSRRQIFLAALGGSAIFMTVGLAGHASGGFASRMPERAMLALKYAGEGLVEPSVADCTQRIVNAPTMESACRFGDPRKAPTVAVWGDSHARSIVPALDEALRERGIAGLNLGFPDCPPVLDIAPLQRSSLLKACGPFKKSVYAGIISDPSIEVVIVLARWASLIEGIPFNNGEGGVEYAGLIQWQIPDSKLLSRETGLSRAIGRTLEGLLASGKKIILVYTVPEAGWNVPYYMAKAEVHGLGPNVTTSFTRFKNRNRSAYQALDGIGQRTNLVRVKPADILCDTFVKDRCVAQLDGIPLYSDDDHLTRQGARMVIEKMMPHIGGASAAARSTRRESD
jgi:peptidoglycan/LPS O-acetylase OafA/YrhL